MNREDGKKGEEKRAFSDSIQMFEDIFKQAAPSTQGSKKNAPAPRHKPPQKSLGANVPRFRRGIGPQERTFKVKLKPSKRAPADLGEPRQIDLPVRAQAGPIKKTPKTTSRKAGGVVVVGLTVLILLATPIFLHSSGVLNLPGLPEFLNFSQKLETPPPPSPKPMRKPPDKAAPPKSDKAGPVLAASATQPSATTLQPAEAPEKPAPSSPQSQSQPPEGFSAKEVVRPAAPLPSARAGAQANESLAFSGEVKPLTPPAAVDGVPKRQEAVRHPFSLYLGSFSTPEQARKALSIHLREDFPPYAVRMDFGDKGVWYRIFMGHFQNREEAEGFVAKHQIKGAEVKETKYAVRLGTFSAHEVMEAKKNSLSTLGFFPYTIKEPDDRVSLYTGAFLRKEDAEKECRDLRSRGIQADPVER
jgi:hypothetical protein